VREIRASMNAESMVIVPENASTMRFGEEQAQDSKMVINLQKTRMSVKSGMMHSISSNRIS
jgi:hypothetical protein